MEEKISQFNSVMDWYHFASSFGFIYEFVLYFLISFDHHNNIMLCESADNLSTYDKSFYNGNIADIWKTALESNMQNLEKMAVGANMPRLRTIRLLKPICQS